MRPVISVTTRSAETACGTLKRVPNFTAGASVMPTIKAATTGSRIERPKCSAAISASAPISKVASNAASRHSAGMSGSGCGSVSVKPKAGSDWLKPRLLVHWVTHGGPDQEQRGAKSRVPSEGAADSRPHSRGAFCARGLRRCAPWREEGRAGRRGPDGPAGLTLSRRSGGTTFLDRMPSGFSMTASPPFLRRPARGVVGLLHTAPGGLTFQALTAFKLAATDPIHRCGGLMSERQGSARATARPPVARGWRAGTVWLGPPVGCTSAPLRSHRISTVTDVLQTPFDVRG